MSFLASVTVLAYGPLWRNGFVYEDRNWAFHRPTRAEVLTLTPSRVLPLATWNTSPQITHGIGLAVHLLNGLLVWWLATRLGLSWPWLAAGIFWLHPLNTEAVAYASARTELFVTMGLGLATCLASEELSGPRLIGLLAASWLAMSAKPNGVVVLGLIPWVWLCQRRQIPRWGILGLLLIGLMALRGLAQYQILNNSLSTGMSWWNWWGLESLAMWRLVSLVVWPVGLSVDHDYVHVAKWIPLAAVLGLIGVVGGWMTLTWQRRSRTSVFAFGWILIVLAPRFALRVPLSVENEHHWYAVMPAVSLWLASLLGPTRHFSIHKP